MGAARNTDELIVSLHAGFETKSGYTDAFVARPADGKPRPGMVLLSGMHGLSQRQREITRYYARAGFVALSPDYMSGQKPEGRAEALKAKNALDIRASVERLAGAANFLRGLPWVGAEGKVGIMGFCLGGGLALLALARTDGFQAGIIYHQSLFPDPRELAGINCKLQCHYGTLDHSTPKAEVDAFTKALDELNKPYDIYWYEDMEHSFAQIAPNEEVPPPRRAAADLSYERSFEFLHQELGQP